MDNVWILIAFGAYLLLMMGIGLFHYRNTKSSEDYFLGGRSLGGWVAALSAQASDMSGWLLMGLPGAIYAYGTGQIWIAVGLAIGTILNWAYVSSRLRRYTIRAGNSLTLPEFFENRFHDSSKVLRVASSLFIMVFFLVYTASGFSAGAKLFSSVFNIDYTIALAIGAFVILVYTFLGGFLGGLPGAPAVAVGLNGLGAGRAAHGAGVGAHAVAVNVLSEKGGKQEKGQPQSGRTGHNAQIQTAVGRIRLGRKAEAAALIFLNMRGNETDLLQIDSFDAVEKKITAAAFAENDPFDPDQQVSQLSNMKLVEALFQFCGEKILAYIRVISDPGADNKASVGRIVRHIRQNPVINISELVGF